MGPLHSVYLIAEREFRIYVATASFWIAMALGPAILTGVLLFAQATARPPTAIPVMVTASDQALGQAVSVALLAAAKADQKRIVIVPTAAAGVTASQGADGGVVLTFSGPAPFSPAARELAAVTLQRDVLARTMGAATKTLAVRTVGPPTAPRAQAAAAISRLALVTLLWTTLTGSLGMLLQAVTRERTNRALESLLAAAQPWEIVLGKVAGVGCVSLLVLASWLAASAVAAVATPEGDGLAPALVRHLSDPMLLMRAAVIYVLAFAFYGLITVDLGARARDSAAAQNLARPMFVVLVAVFFVALSIAGGAQGISWLIYLPPFTPFLLLLQAWPLKTELIAVLGLAVATVGAGCLAARDLKIER